MLPGDFNPQRPSRKRLAILGIIVFLGMIGSAILLVVGIFVISAWWGQPLSIFGLSDGPDQPLEFPHTVHVQEAGMDCTFCHRNVTKGASATVPAVALCMTCHKTVGDDIEEVEKLRNIYAKGEPITWMRVHRLPDHVRFVHEPHIRHFSGSKKIVKKIDDADTQITISDANKINPNAKTGEIIDVQASQVCSICHGNVGDMTKVRQVRPLKMGDCVNCHRDNGAPAECATCHY